MDIIQLNGLVDECKIKFKIDKSNQTGNIMVFTPYIDQEFIDEVGLLVTIGTEPIYMEPISTDVFDNPVTDMDVPGPMLGTSKVVYYDRYNCDIDPIIITNLNCDIPQYYINCYLILGSNLAYSKTFTNVSHKNALTAASIPGNIITEKPVNPSSGDVYFDIKENRLYVWSDILQKWDYLAYDVVVMKFKPKTPYLNMMLYDQTENKLFIWNGTIWKQIKTVQDGIPLYDKEGSGKIGGNEARKTLMNYVKMSLGYPQVMVELTDQQIDLAISNALGLIRQKSDVAYMRVYIPFEIQPGKQSYFLNNPAMGTDKIVEILSIVVTIWGGFGSMDAYTQQLFVNTFMNPVGVTDLLGMWEWSNMLDDIQKIMVAEVAYTWDESSRVMKIFRKFSQNKVVLIEAAVERPEQVLITDRNVRMWIQNYAIADCKSMLSQIRGKYDQLPGPNNGISMNGGELASQAEAEKEKLIEQLEDMTHSRLGEWGNVSIYLG